MPDDVIGTDEVVTLPDETPNAVNPNIPTESEKATIDQSVASAHVVWTNHASGTSWGAATYEGMVMHNIFALPNSAGTKTCTVNAAILVRGNCPNDPTENVSYYTNTLSGPIFRINSGGGVNLYNGTSLNGGRATLEGARLYHTVNGTAVKSQWNVAGNWTTGSAVDMAPLLYVNGGTAKIYETYFQNAYSKTYTYQSAAGNGGAIRMSSGTLTMYANGVAGPNSTTTGSACKIMDCTAVNGGGIYVGGGTATLNGVTISGCKATNGGAIFVGASGKAVLRSSCVIDNCTASSNGGGIYVANDGELEISSTTIKNCDAAHGGAIYLAGNCTVTLNSVTIQNNTVTGNGGAMWIGENATINHTGGTISNNTAAQVGGAIALARAGATYNLSGGTISGNTAVQGGAIGCYGAGSGATNNGNPDFNMSGGTISNNTATATDSGGAIYIRCGSGHSVSGGTITGNKGTKGAGIYVYDSSASYVGTAAGKITISGSANINKNGTSTTTHGGGVYVGSGGTLAMTGGTIGGTSVSSHANQANAGGGICIAGGTATISGGSVNYNKAFNNGGGIEMSSGTLTISGGAVNGNNANYGGAIHLTTGCTVTLSGGTLNSNVATDSGGAIAQGGGTVNMSGTAKINSNTATSRGGGIYSSGASILNITGSTTAGACTISSNTSNSQGGGIFLDTITTADNVKINNITINGNTANTNRGGGIFVNPTSANKNVIVRISGAVISNNTAEPVDSADTDAEGHGGGIYQGNCKMYIANSTFTNNKASIRGGGLYCTSNTVTEVKNCTFTNNESKGLQSGAAVGRGGGLYAYDNAQVTVINTTFNGNSSNTHAGAIGANGVSSNIAQLNLVDVTIGSTTANTASGNGGGIYASTSTDVKIVRGNISNNEAANGGGIYAETTTATVKISDNTNILTTVPSGVAATGAGTVISGNNATAGNGGGVCVSTANIEINSAQINNNTASGFGGGVQLYKAKGVGNDAIAFSNIKVNGNTSTGNAGGGICVDTAVLNLSGNNEINNNTAYYYGGGVVVRVDGGGTGTSTVNVNINDTGATAINGNAVTTSYGGGVHVSSLGVSSFNMKGGTINNNTCNNASGGGIDCEDNVSLNGTTVSGNTAKYGGNIAFGGGINVRTATGNLTLVNCSVSDNESQCGGGIAVTDGASATVTGGTVTDNIADEAGGLLVFNGSTSGFTGTTVSGNTAENGDGGGVMVAHNSTLTMTNCYVINNSAEGVYTAEQTTMVNEHTLVGTGGGLGVYDNSTLTFTVDNNNGAIYGNTATTAGDDVFANGLGTQIYIPAPTAMNTTGFGKTDAVWWEDYMTDDTNYSQGLNGEPRVIERYDLTPISIRAYTTSAEGASPSGRYINDAGRYVAISFDVQKYNMGSIKITAPEATDENQRFVFTVSGTTTLDDVVNFTISLPAGESVTIAKLLPGSYTVTMQDGWSWRYTLNGATLGGASAGDGSGTIEVTVTGLEVDELHEVEYSASRTVPYWLDHNSPIRTNTATQVAARIEMDEFKRSYII